jgi:chromosome segregation ATPase
VTHDEARARELLNREYGKDHSAARHQFTITFRTTTYEHQVRELTEAFAARAEQALESLRDRIATIADEAGEGLQPVQSADESLTHIEHVISRLHDSRREAESRAEKAEADLAEARLQTAERITDELSELLGKLDEQEFALVIGKAASGTVLGAQLLDDQRRLEKAEGEVERLKSRCRCCDRPAKMDGLCTSARCRQFATYGRTFDDEPEPGKVEQARAEGYARGRADELKRLTPKDLPPDVDDDAEPLL